MLFHQNIDPLGLRGSYDKIGGAEGVPLAPQHRVSVFVAALGIINSVRANPFAHHPETFL